MNIQHAKSAFPICSLFAALGNAQITDNIQWATRSNVAWSCTHKGG